MKHKLFAGAAALGLLLSGANHAEAARKLPVTLKLTALTQGESSTNGNSQKQKVVKTKFTTSDLLQVIAEYYSTTFPSGAELVLVDFDQFVVYSGDPQKNGSVLKVVDKSVLSYTESASVIQGSNNTKNNSYSGTRNYYMTIRFDDGAGSVITMSGYAADKASGNTSSGDYQDSVKASVAGSGATPAEGDVVLTGSVTISGKGSDTPTTP